MTVAELLRLRMANFQLTRKLFSRPEDLTVHLGAVQAQDFAGGIWALGMRMPTGSFRDIEAAIRKKSIIRTWSLRGTLHFLPATQARWILGLVYPRLLVHYGGIFRKLGLEDHIIAKSQIIIRKTLSGGKQLTRDEISQSLEGNGIPTGGLRSNFLFYRAAWEQLICFGPRRGKQFTFTLMDEWIPPSRKVSREEGITLLTLIYFTSHGPATIKDFSWWSGLGPQEAWQGIEDLGKDLEPIQVAGQTFYRHGGQKVPDGHRDPLFLLPPFDEYTVAF
ncbi:MAG TPA: winged helix DNA-binding domain-containing protein, partial [Chitinophagaceae bacterium]|nr:winged helix DNA-binding domain-containing protein [Chitinophagaceae bacterium]